MECFAAYAKDETIRMLGSSGGIFPILSLQHLNEGGVVYASAYDDNFHAVFQRVTEIDDLKRCFGSKYMQSRINNTYKDVARDMTKGRKVLFCGTPCQVSGLQAFLTAKKITTENLLLIDFICHGVPSEKAFDKYSKKHLSANIISLNMRDKQSGWNWGNFSWKFSHFDGSVSLQNQRDVPYMKGFLSNIYLRPSCYNCLIKGKSDADITLGDFWGITDINPSISAHQGVSAVITRTEKGKNRYSLILDALESFSVEHRDIEKANPSLVRSVSVPFRRTYFFKNLDKFDFDELISKTCAPTFKNRLFNKLYSYFPLPKSSCSDLFDKENFFVSFKTKTRCCGCSACLSVCAHNAIFFKLDSEGFLYPIIDKDKCIGCGLCKKVCVFAN